MDYLNTDTGEGFDRLQRVLVQMREGDAMMLSEAIRISGLPERICSGLLEGLARAGHMSHEPDGRFVRRSTLGLA